jgi:hypothetical protein
MAARNLLHKTRLNDFKFFLDDKGLAYRQGKGTYQVLQVQHPVLGWQSIYEKLEAPEHYSVPDKLIPLVMEFIKYNRDERRPRTDYKAGEEWYVRLPQATTLTTVFVGDVTGSTVEITEKAIGAHSKRYVKHDIEFIEKLSS